MPLASAHFVSFFSTYGVTHHVYCQCYTDFVKEQLKIFARSWCLMERLIGIQVQGMQVEVLFYPVGQYPCAWEVKGISSLQVFPSFGPLEQGCGGPSEDFFEKLNRIQYMWMSHSDGIYSPPDSSESILSDLFGSTDG